MEGSEAAGGVGQRMGPLVDRHEELQLLQEYLERVVGGSRARSRDRDRPAGHAVLLLGESGVGKSRLVAEAVTTARQRGIRVVTAQCVGRGAEPLLPLRDGLAAQLGKSPARIRRMLAGASLSLVELVPFVGRFLGAAGKAFGERNQFAAALDGIYKELARVLVGMSERDGLCLVVEDLHAGDPDTLYFLNYFFRQPRPHRVVTLVTVQEEQLPDTPELADCLTRWRREGSRMLPVPPLERTHVGELVKQMTPQDQPVGEDLVDGLFDLTGGNPFFLEETVRLLADDQMPARISSPDRQLQVPDRVEAVLHRRLTRASRPARHFLEAAAVALETTQDLDVIIHVTGLEMDGALALLAEACELGLMNEGPQGELSFTHDLMHRMVYGTIGANSRRRLHGLAAEWYEQNGRFTEASFQFERSGRNEDMVRTALEAAAQSERAGMYHSARTHYEKVRPFVDLADLGPRLGRALIVLGDWQQAEDLIELLPVEDGRVRLLRSELRFVLGDFGAAASEARQALETGTDRVDVLIRLAEIALYLGHLEEATQWAREGDELARAGSSVGQQARCSRILGVVAHFSGDIDQGQQQFQKALELIRARPEDRRDRTIHTALLGNLGGIAESRGEWERAERYHQDALDLRREAADARGMLHSLHAVGRVRLFLGEATGGLSSLEEAELLAADMDEPLERAKIAHTHASLELVAEDYAAADLLAGGALEVFLEHKTHHDVTHARLTLSQAALGRGDERRGVEEASVARGSVERHGYGLLRHLYPDVAFSWSERLLGAFVALAYVDADLSAFLATLPDERSPSTDLSPSITDASGALIYALPVGWVTPLNQPDRRRDLAMALSSATHVEGKSQVAAGVIAACASWVLEGASSDLLLEVALEEAAVWDELCVAPPGLSEMLASIRAGRSTPPDQGIGLDPIETVGAVLACVVDSSSLREALQRAVAFGSDADTVASLVAGLLGARLDRDQAFAELPRHTAALLPDAHLFEGTAAGLARLRAMEAD